MPRRSAATIRPVEPDARFRNRLVQQLINKVMSDGKKQLAERIVYDALAIVGERSSQEPVDQLDAAGVSDRKKARSQYGVKAR